MDWSVAGSVAQHFVRPFICLVARSIDWLARSQSSCQVGRNQLAIVCSIVAIIDWPTDRTRQLKVKVGVHEPDEHSLLFIMSAIDKAAATLAGRARTTESGALSPCTNNLAFEEKKIKVTRCKEDSKLA